MWVAEPPSILWSLRTMPSRATSFMPFFMVHWSEAVLPTNIDYGSPRIRAYTEEGNQVALEDAIDQLDEAHDVALLHLVRYQQTLRCYHERNVRSREFQVRDLVLRWVQTTRADTSSCPDGRGHSSSIKCSDTGHSRSDTRMARSSPTHGT
jgi:hypothetical protein